MGLLSNDYWKDAAETQQAPAPQTQPQPQPTAGTQPAPVITTPSTVVSGSTPSVFTGKGFFASNAEKIVQNNQLSPEDQAKKYGGAVGSPEYFQYKSNQNPFVQVGKRLGPYMAAGATAGAFFGPIGIAVGTLIGAGVGAASFPNQDETWDSLTTKGKAEFLANSGGYATYNMVTALPAELARAPIRFGVSVGQPWVRLAQGKDATLEGLAKAPTLEVPFLGKIPTYYQSYQEARDSGLGPIGAALGTGGVALGDAVMVGALGEAAAKALQPRAPVTTPIGEATIQNIEPVKALVTRDSGGAATGVARTTPGSATEYYTLPKATSKEFGGNSGNTFLKLTPVSPEAVELSVVQTRGGMIQRGVDWLRGAKTTTGDFGPEIKIQSQTIPLSKGGTVISSDAPVSIPNSVTKGFENKPVTMDQITNLGRIGDANGINPAVRDSVIRSVTGKTVMGEMTQAEYVKAAQTLGLFNNAAKYTPQNAFLNPAAQWLSPQRRWMRSYEESSGIPVYSEVYVPLENAVRTRDVFRDTWRGTARDIFGKYADAGHVAERQAINSYMKGDTSAILGNQAFDASTRAELVKVADSLRQAYDTVGPVLGVDPVAFLADYQPRIQNIGGVFQLYKEGSTVPTSIDFFAKFKRKGNSTAPLIDDALALFDIYVNAGSNSTFVSPVLERVGNFTQSAPGTIQGSVKAYVQEKLGYAGRLEQALDEVVPVINQKLGLNLPPDAARQFGDVVLSTQYAGLLSQPATWFRQMFQYPLLGYARLGPKFVSDAYRLALTKEGLKELSDKGFLVDTSYPYGGSIAQESTMTGNLMSRYKSTTQAVISPNSHADNIQRAVVYHQFKLQFEDALGRYNAGKISWSQFERDINMSSYSLVDQNIARQKIVKGDVEGAFDHLVRDVIDETQFPYRKAATARVGYGFGGKLATSLLQWPLEASHTLGSWIKQGAQTGDFSKLIRYYAASTVIQRTMQNTFGMDFTRSLFLGPVLSSSPASPAVQLAANTFGMVMNSPWLGAVGGQNNRELFNENKDQVLRTLNAAGYPGALEAQNIRRFKNSIARGPDENGLYAALDNYGNVKYFTDFTGIFMGELMGFPIDQKVREATLNREMINAQVDQQDVKRTVMQLLQQEKYDQASGLMEQYGIKVTPQDLDNYYIPRSQRTFQSLPASIKAQFAPRVFPEAFNSVE